jgi:hypothetical protein
MSRKPCGQPIPGGTCPYPRHTGKQKCFWHWLAAQPAHVQHDFAKRRAESRQGQIVLARVPATEWPDGERWCAGCQGFIPLFYCSGSRCKAHESAAAHGSRIYRQYGITGEEYDEILRAQKGRCYICHRKPQTLRLAVDHDHVTGEVRGLLCGNNEFGCNAAVVANLEGAHDGGLEAAKRAVLYLFYPPYRRMRDGRGLSWAGFVAQEHARLAEAAQEASGGTGAQSPPF